MSEDPQEVMREDNELYCPRRDKQVLILGQTCFCRERDQLCAGCILDREFVHMKVIWLMSDILNMKDGLTKEVLKPEPEVREILC